MLIAWQSIGVAVIQTSHAVAATEFDQTWICRGSAQAGTQSGQHDGRLAENCLCACCSAGPSSIPDHPAKLQLLVLTTENQDAPKLAVFLRDFLSDQTQQPRSPPVATIEG